MIGIHQEIVPKPEHEAPEADRSSQEENASEATKELFRRDPSPTKAEEKVIKIEIPMLEAPKPPPVTPTHRTSSKPIMKPMIIAKKEGATKKKSSSGIPLRLKSGTNTVKSSNKMGTYRHSPSLPKATVINKNTLEVQFMNNKKRLLQLHAELVDKQRPLVDMHKSLLRTKKQLEELGKKVVLEDLKVVSLKVDDTKHQLDGAGENPAVETAKNLKNSIEEALDACVTVCKKSFVKRDHIVKMLEGVPKFTMEATETDAKTEELKKEKEELENSVETTIKESEKKIEELIDNWQKSNKTTVVNDEMKMRVDELEEVVKQQQKTIQDTEDNVHSLTRKMEERKASYEKAANETQEKYAKLEEDLKKEKKSANENLMKTRNLRSKFAEFESRSKEAEERSIEATTKLKQLQDQMRRKEIQWMKEKDEFKKNEALLQQSLTEKQNQFDTRLKEIETQKRSIETEQLNFCRNIETQLEIKDQECMLIEKEKDTWAEKSRFLEEQIEEFKKQLEEKEKEIDDLSVKVESVPAIEYKCSESHFLEIMEYKQKVTDVQNTVDQQSEQISKMQGSLKAHAKLAAALKLEKDNAIKYANKLRDILQEARDELEFKNKTIYKIHEKLVLKDKAHEKLRLQLKEYETCSESSNDKWKNRCQICMSSVGDERENSSCVETEVGKCSVSAPQYVSESLIGMSVKKVDHLRARLDSLKKMKLPSSNPGMKYSGSHHSCNTQPLASHLRKQIEMRGKLYQILQKHADQSCEDFINLLKLTVSGGSRGTLHIDDELKPSNMKVIDETLKNYVPRKFTTSNIKVTESFNAISQHLGALPINEIYDKIRESNYSDTDDIN